MYLHPAIIEDVSAARQREALRLAAARRQVRNPLSAGNAGLDRSRAAPRVGFRRFRTAQTAATGRRAYTP
jgi:hypothetical protein